jgi:hypothetical protein
MSRNFSNFKQGGSMEIRFLGKDPDSAEGDSPTLWATDRMDRRTYIAQRWVVTDPQVLASVGPIPNGEAIIEIPEEVLRFYQRNQGADH